MAAFPGSYPTNRTGIAFRCTGRLPAEQCAMLDQLLQFGGRVHPMVLHVPIGVLAALAACEAWGLLRRRPLEREWRRLLCLLAFGSALAAGGSGWLLAEEPGYGGQTLTLHRWLGVALVAVLALASIGALAGRTRLYGAMIVAALALMGPAGHLGGSMTHGENFLTAPFRKPTAKPERPDPTATDAAEGIEVLPISVFGSTIMPIFEDKCVSCHNDSKRKGGLAMHTAQALLEGGDTGPAFIAGDPEGSEMIWRARLPLDDEYHMPPEDKPQLTDSELAAIVAWILAGAEINENP